MHQVFNTLATKFPNVVFLTVDAEETPSLSEQFDVAVVPTFVCVSPDSTVFWRHEGMSRSIIHSLLVSLFVHASCFGKIRICCCFHYRSESPRIGETCQKCCR